MSKVAGTSFSHGIVPAAVTIVAGVAVVGAGREHASSWGLSRNSGAGQAEISVAVDAATSGVRGSFYTKAVGSQSFPMDLVKVGVVDLVLVDVDTIAVRVNGTLNGTTITLTNSIYIGFTNQISFSIDLHASAGAATFIVNGDTLTLSSLNTVTTGVSAFSILGMNGSRSGSSLADICVYDDAGASFNGIPPFTRSRKAGTSGVAGTFTDWLPTGTIPSTPKNSVTVTPTIPSQDPIYAGYSPIQKKHYWVTSNIWIIVDVSNATVAPVITYNTTISRPSQIATAAGHQRTAIYVQPEDRIYFSASDGLRYFDCQTETGSVVLESSFNDMTGLVYAIDTHKLYGVKNTASIAVYDIPQQLVGTSITTTSACSAGDYCSSTKELFFVGALTMTVINSTTDTEVVGSPYTTTATLIAGISYNPIADSMCYADAANVYFMKCDTRAVTDSGMTENRIAGMITIDSNSGAAYATRGGAGPAQFVHGRYKTGATYNEAVGAKPVNIGTRSQFVFDPERGSMLYFNQARTTFVEGEVYDDGTPTTNDMVVRGGDTGKIVSAIVHDKHSIAMNKDLSVNVTVPQIIGINIQAKNVTGDDSNIQFGTADELGNSNLGALEATTAISKDIVLTKFVNSQDGNLTATNVDNLEITMEAF